MSGAIAFAEGLLGRIWEQVRKVGNPRACWLWTGYLKNGYGVISAYDHPLYVHRVVFVVFRGQVPAGMEICHRCDVKTCVRPKHLFAGTQADNMADMRAKGRGSAPPHFYGEAHPLTTISDADVVEIRRLRSSMSATQRALAKRFGVSQSTIWRIAHGVVRS